MRYLAQKVLAASDGDAGRHGTCAKVLSTESVALKNCCSASNLSSLLAMSDMGERKLSCSDHSVR